MFQVITFGKDRLESTARMKRVLEEFTIEGVATTLPFHLRLIAEPDFIEGRFDTEYVGRNNFEELAGGEGG